MTDFRSYKKSPKDPNHQDMPEELQQAILDILNQCDREDFEIRRQQIRIWKKYEKFWHGIQYVFWSETQNDWLSPVDGLNTNNSSQDENREGSEGVFYDYVMNVYRAYGESIIAALAAQIPAIRFPPDDADDEADRLTSKTYSKISDLIDRHNSAKIIFFNALFALWNQGIVCAYHYSKTDPKYGMLKTPIYKPHIYCKDCGYEALSSEELDCPNCFENYDSQSNSFGVDFTGNSYSDSSDSELDPNISDPGQIPNQIPNQQPKKLTESVVLEGFKEDQPKARVQIEIFGPMFVKIPAYAKNQEQCGYLLNSTDQPKSLLKDVFCFDKKTKKFNSDLARKIDASNADYDMYERIGRAPSSFTYVNNYDNADLSTVRRGWFRPFEYQRLGDDRAELRDKLYELFPEGLYACFVGQETFIEAREECLDHYWTIGKCGLSTYIHSDPMGQPLIPAQEMKNTITNLTIETIEQGIPDTYADPEVLDFGDYGQHERRPGVTYPATPKPGTNLRDSFYEGPRATLSGDVAKFENQNQQDSQFLVAAFPSIYGGPQEAESRTASEYNMSRQMALQRLSITWTYLTDFWARMKEKCVRLYIENLVEDEKFVTKDESDNYVNVWIRKSELMGKVGTVEPEGSETFPVTMAQKQSTILQLLQMGNPDINAVILDPENVPLVFDAAGFPEIKLPADNQRVKQVNENQYMIKTGQVIAIEPLLDDDLIHINTAKNFLVSDDGQDLKNSNIPAYQAIMQHILMHQTNIQTQQLQQQIASGASQRQNPVNGQNPENSPAPKPDIKPVNGTPAQQNPGVQIQ